MCICIKFTTGSAHDMTSVSGPSQVPGEPTHCRSLSFVPPTPATEQVAEQSPHSLQFRKPLNNGAGGATQPYQYANCKHSIL